MGPLPLRIPRRYHPPLLFAYVLLLIGSALSAFSFGFFLTRYTLLDRAVCDDPPLHPSVIAATAAPHSFAYQSQSAAPSPRFAPADASASAPPLAGCWLPSTYSHAILLLIDALRFNFTAQLPSLSRALSSSPSSTLLLPFLADPPTVTLQRLAALTTGSLPTFIDFASNFASSAISCDSLILQLRDSGAGWRRTFMGDDTWMALYPAHFSAAYPYPSFNVKDLHTVDQGCVDHLLPTLHRQRRDAVQRSVVIAHFLGVDHVGHRYHAEHPTMREKLAEMDGVIEDVIRFVDERSDVPTLLLVFGDHGMTSDGNHGGATAVETTSALFVHASQPFMPALDAGWSGVLPSSVAQIDLVTSLALLLGLPIPFGSLGAIIPQLFLPSLSSSHLLAASYINAFSVWRYLSVYQAAAGSFDDARMAELGRLFVHTSDAYARLLRAQGTADQEEEVAVVRGFQRYVAESVTMCREKWATFNLSSMTAGIVALVLTTAMMATLLIASRSRPTLLSSIAVPATTGWVVGAALGALSSPVVPEIPLKFVLLLSASVSSAVTVLAALWADVSRGSAWALPEVGLPHWVSAACTVGYMQGLFSNSFIIHELHVVFFMAMSILLSSLPSSLAPWQSKLCAVVALRLTTEMGDVIPSSSLSSTFFSPLDIAAIVACLAGLPLLLRRMASHTAMSVAPCWWVYERVVPAACALCGLYWTLQSSSSDGAVATPAVSRILDALGLGGLDGFLVRTALPQLVYASSYVGVAALLYDNDRFMRLAQKPPRSPAAQRSTADLRSPPPCRTTAEETAAELASQSLNPTVFALLLPTFLLLLGPKSSVLFLLALVVVHNAPFVPRFSFPHVCFLWFASLSLFFSSSHAQTFSSLQISAAFVGFEAFHLVPAGVMLAGNTFVHLWMLSSWVGGGGWRAGLGVLTLFCARLCCTMGNAMVNRRHLMVWEIFAPKFVFDGLSTVVVAALVLLVHTALLRATR